MKELTAKQRKAIYAKARKWVSSGKESYICCAICEPLDIDIYSVPKLFPELALFHPTPLGGIMWRIDKIVEPKDRISIRLDILDFCIAMCEV